MSFVKFEKKVVWKCLRKLKVLPWERTEVNWWDVQQMVGPPPSCKDPLACQVSPKYVILTPDNRVSRAAQISKGKHYKERGPNLCQVHLWGDTPSPFLLMTFWLEKHLLRVGAGRAGEGQTNLLQFFISLSNTAEMTRQSPELLLKRNHEKRKGTRVALSPHVSSLPLNTSEFIFSD